MPKTKKAKSTRKNRSPLGPKMTKDERILLAVRCVQENRFLVDDQRKVIGVLAGYKEANPKSIVRPRDFSSGKRSVSTPVSARTSEVLP